MSDEQPPRITAIATEQVPGFHVMSPYERVLKILDLLERHGDSGDPRRESCKQAIRDLMRVSSDMFAELTLLIVCLQVSVPDIEWTMNETLIRLKRAAADAQDALLVTNELQRVPTPPSVM